MSLQFIIGASGAGKSHYAYERILREADQHPEVLYYIVVPEQFTLQTQRNVVGMSPGKGILNIDVLSFQRLAYRVFEEVGGDTRRMLEDTGKSMIIRKLSQELASDLPYLGSQMNRPGCLDEVKSLFSEFMQYDVGLPELRAMQEKAGAGSLLEKKLRDTTRLYEAFKEYLSGRYMTGEEVMDVLANVLPLSQKLHHSVILFDGFTGFTPVQLRVIRELLALADRILVTVTMDAGGDLYTRGNPYQLFYMSREMIRVLSDLTNDMEEPVLLFHNEKTRFREAPALRFLEENLFRYKGRTFRETDRPAGDRQDTPSADPGGTSPTADRPERVTEEQQGERKQIRIRRDMSPAEEMDHTASEILRLVRERGMRFSDIAVITGNLAEYAPLSRQSFKSAGIPCFIDETHSVLMNPFVEYLRSAMEMVLVGFSYESVFRHLRCRLSGLTDEAVDRLENYVRALGIRGFSSWQKEWTYWVRGILPEELELLNEWRLQFVSEIEEFARAFGNDGRTVREYCTALYELVVRGQIQEKLKQQEERFREEQELSLQKEYSQIYGIVMDLLDRMVDILGDEPITRQEYLQILETGFQKAKVALIPPGQDQVLVGDMERTRLRDIKALFFVGVNEGNVPKNVSGGGILSEMDREFFAREGIPLAPDSREQLGIQRFYLYLNLTKPSGYLCLSYSAGSSTGEVLSPAYLIGNIKALFPDAEQETETLIPEQPLMAVPELLDGLSRKAWRQQDPLFAELYSWFLTSPEYKELLAQLTEAAFAVKSRDDISRAAAKALYGEISPYGATRLERMAACAFAHYMRYGLKLLERQEYEFKAMDLGNIMHESLEKFALELQERGLTWKNLTDEQQEEIMQKCLAEVTGGYGNQILADSARNAYMVKRAARILDRTLTVLRSQLRNGTFEPEGFEVSFGGGRIDRVDVLEEDDKVYVKIIDYKTGSTRFDLTLLYHGLQMQLAIYLDGALTIEQKKHPDKEVLPAGIFYYNIKDPLIRDSVDAEEESIEKSIRRELKMNGLVRADRHVAESMDETLESLPVRLTKTGGFYANSPVASREQFDILNRYAKKKIRELIGRMKEGDTEVNPYRKDSKNACEYCPYKGVCGFDKKLPGYRFRNLYTMSSDEAWQAMGEEVNKE